MLPFAIDALAKEDRILQKILSTYLPCTPAFRLSQEMMAVVNKIEAKCTGGDRPRGSGKANRKGASTVPHREGSSLPQRSIAYVEASSIPRSSLCRPVQERQKSFSFQAFHFKNNLHSPHS
ncbi:hypothetical protein SAMD00079811_69430 [Scytonema sp. HK-05]|uniref:hypothetical protein n=1 Tax=Scytonema sp. HK-05 TaxID=1137095 RepID=UPI000AAD0102|nr:hypothetical protein [Scytonema sp. HK-05]BAY49314.1 hypothetical protein SAMD00079811_69430 [Scytonema sp. HK-05]